MAPTDAERPTIADLERIMDEAAGRSVTINPDGTLTIESDEKDKRIAELEAENNELRTAARAGFTGDGVFAEVRNEMIAEGRRAGLRQATDLVEAFDFFDNKRASEVWTKPLVKMLRRAAEDKK